MAHSTGRKCEAIKQLIFSQDYVTNRQLTGNNIVCIDTLNEDLQTQLEKAGCDWPVFVENGNNIKIYFSCCCSEGSVITIEATTKTKAYFELLRSTIIEYVGKNYKRAS
jgi:hypothetical protein